MGDKPRITQNELMKNLVSARKIMGKVETGDYERGNINEDVLLSDPEDLLKSEAPAPVSIKPVGKADPDKINQSRLPEAIKRAMIENPIPEITLSEGLDMNFVNKTRKLMEQDGTLSSKQSLSKRTTTSESAQLPNNIETIIENVIRRVLDEKLTQILNAQAGTTINENLAIKVGSSIFTGKITKVKNSK
jgi:hypothetical protein